MVLNCLVNCRATVCICTCFLVWISIVVFNVSSMVFFDLTLYSFTTHFSLHWLPLSGVALNASQNAPDENLSSSTTEGEIRIVIKHY